MVPTNPDAFGSNTESAAGSYRDYESNDVASSLGSKKRKRRGGLRRDQGAVVRDAITALALCHNVTPTYPDPNNKEIVEY